MSLTSVDERFVPPPPWERAGVHRPGLGEGLPKRQPVPLTEEVGAGPRLDCCQGNSTSGRAPLGELRQGFGRKMFLQETPEMGKKERVITHLLPGCWRLIPLQKPGKRLSPTSESNCGQTGSWVIYPLTPSRHGLGAAPGECSPLVYQCMRSGGCVTKYHKLRGLKPQKCVVSQLWRPEV